MRPNWREIYSNLAHVSDRDDELIPVTRETLRLAKGALRKMNEDDYYHNNGAAEQEIIEALKQEEIMAKENNNAIIEFNYKNHAGKYGLRKVIPARLEFTKTHWHPEMQWIIHCYDLDKREMRSFALSDCDFLFVTEGAVQTEHIKKNLKEEGPKHPDGTPLTREEVKDSENAYYNDPDGELG